MTETVWRNPRLNRLNWMKIGFIALFTMVVPGIAICLISASWKVWVVPFFGLTLAQVLNQPVLNIILGILWFLCAPNVVVIALASFIVGIRIWLDL